MANKDNKHVKLGIEWNGAVRQFAIITVNPEKKDLIFSPMRLNTIPDDRLWPDHISFHAKTEHHDVGRCNVTMQTKSGVKGPPHVVCTYPDSVFSLVQPGQGSPIFAQTVLPGRGDYDSFPLMKAGGRALHKEVWKLAGPIGFSVIGFLVHRSVDVRKFMRENFPRIADSKQGGGLIIPTPFETHVVVVVTSRLLVDYRHPEAIFKRAEPTSAVMALPPIEVLQRDELAVPPLVIRPKEVSYYMSSVKPEEYEALRFFMPFQTPSCLYQYIATHAPTRQVSQSWIFPYHSLS